jgi:glycosyltransferase involved in cell wall biosynthesis
MTALRMLFLALWAPDYSPGQRYRVEQFLDYWHENGVRTDYKWVLDGPDAAAFYGDAIGPKGRVVMRATLRRVASVLHALRRSRYDVVFVQREAFFLGGPWSEWLACRRAPLILDFDDAIWLRAVSKRNQWLAPLKNVQKIPEIVRLANTVIAGNSFLATWARQYSSNVVVVPTCVDTDRYVPRNPETPCGGPVVIGWSGSPSTIEHFKLAIPALERLRRRFGSRIRFKVVGDPTYRCDSLDIDGEAWRVDGEVAALQNMDIGIMPTPNDDWGKGKCGLKALTYMSTGIPTVASPFGVNSEIISDGRNGYTPRSQEEWVDRLSRLVEDEAHRRQLGRAGRATVVERYSTSRWRSSLLRLIRQTAAGWAVHGDAYGASEPI